MRLYAAVSAIRLLVCVYFWFCQSSCGHLFLVRYQWYIWLWSIVRYWICISCVCHIVVSHFETMVWCAFFCWHENHFSVYVVLQATMLLRRQYLLHKIFLLCCNVVIKQYWISLSVMHDSDILWFNSCFLLTP